MKTNLILILLLSISTINLFSTVKNKLNNENLLDTKVHDINPDLWNMKLQKQDIIFPGHIIIPQDTHTGSHELFHTVQQRQGELNPVEKNIKDLGYNKLVEAGS